MEEYNEQGAIDYIRTRLSEESNNAYNDDEILNVIDIIFDYYEDHGFLEIDMDEDDEDLDIDDLVAYVRKMVAKDKKSPVKPDDVEAIVKAEVEYEDNIENY